MRAWFEALDMRERLMVGSAALFVAAMLYFLLIWEPLATTNKRLQAEISDSRQLNVLMQDVAATARSSGNRGGTSQINSNRSLLSLIDETSKKSGIADAVKRIQPEGDKTVRVWMEAADFDAVVNWLNDLKKRHGIEMSNGNLDRDDKPGMIKARLTLERAGL